MLASVSWFPGSSPAKTILFADTRGRGALRFRLARDSQSELPVAQGADHLPFHAL